MEKGLIFTYVTTYGGALASLYRPFLGLLIYICFAIIRPESLWYWSVPKGNYSRIVAIGLLIGWALHGFGDWRFGRARAIVLALLGFLFWACLSAILAPDQREAWDWVEKLSKIVLPFLAGMTLVDSVAKLKQIAWVIVISHGYVAYEANLSYYHGFNAVFEIGFAGMDNNCIAIDMVTCAGLAFFLGFNARGWWRKALAFGSAGLMVHVVLFSFSRGGMVALIVTGAISFWMIPKRPSYYLILILALLIGIRLAGKEVVERFVTTFASKEERDASAESRLDMWKDCLVLMGKHPVFGIGPHHFPLIASSLGYTPLKEAHSLWLQTGAEIGVPGLGMLVVFYMLGILRLWPMARGRPRLEDPWFGDSARMVIAALAGFVISAQFVSLVGLESPYYIVLLGGGVLKLAGRTTNLPALPNPSPFVGLMPSARIRAAGVAFRT